jgi:hypothetical protein
MEKERSVEPNEFLIGVIDVADSLTNLALNIAERIEVFS